MANPQAEWGSVVVRPPQSTFDHAGLGPADAEFPPGGSVAVATNQAAAELAAPAATLGIGLHPFFAVVTDAGTPGLSDPGFRLVRACRRRGLPVVPVPGPSALTAVLSAAGLPTNGFLFVGFLPAKSAARIAFLENHRDFPYTIALYESCHRIAKFIDEIEAGLGPNRVICVAKEATKVHETFLVGPATDVRQRLAQTSLKGEFVVLVAPADFVL